MCFVHDQECTEKDRGADSREYSQERRDRPFIGKVACDLDLEGIIRMVCDNVGGIAHALEDRHYEGSRMRWRSQQCGKRVNSGQRRQMGEGKEVARMTKGHFGGGGKLRSSTTFFGSSLEFGHRSLDFPGSSFLQIANPTQLRPSMERQCDTP